MRKKILIITKEDLSAWKSCQHITGNLLQSYKRAYANDEFHYLKVENFFSVYLGHKYAEQIKSMQVDLIVWLDHQPCAAFMIMGLEKVFRETPYEKRPKILVHLFGDFVLDCQQWEQAETAMNNYPVHLIAASDRQQKIVDKFFITDSKLTSVVPFPVDHSVFNLNDYETNRKVMREKFHLKDELVLIYTGRISFQKNVEVIINSLNKIKGLVDKKIELWIVGPWDDLLVPYLGMKGMPGSYYSQFQSSLQDKDLSSVRFLGNLDPAELNKTYQAADLFVSFSTFNDDDYGMSIAEALVLGLPCVLSDWGGLASFANYSKEVELVPVEFNEMRMVCDTQWTQKKLLKKIFQVHERKTDRAANSKEAASHVTIESVGKRLMEIEMSSQKMSPIVFSNLFYKLCSLFHLASHAPFKNNMNLYKEIYGDYANSKV